MYLLENNTVYDEHQGVQIEVEVEPSAIPAPVVAPPLIDKPIPSTVENSAILSSDATSLTDNPMTSGPRSIDAGSNICTIPEQQHLRILDEAFGSDHGLHNHVLCAKNGCKSLSSSEKSRQLPLKPHVFKHE